MFEKHCLVTNDIDMLAESIRKNASMRIKENNIDNLDEFISIGQMKNLINEYAEIDDNNIVLSKNAFEKIFDETTQWIISVGLAKLAAENIIECAWDDTENDIIFWTN